MSTFHLILLLSVHFLIILLHGIVLFFCAYGILTIAEKICKSQFVGRMKKWLKSPLCIFMIFCISFVIYYTYSIPKKIEMRNQNLVREINLLNEKIETFRTEHGRLPNDWNEMDIGILGDMDWYYKAEYDGSKIYYHKWDSLNYCISFVSAIDGFESNSYCSDSRGWHFYD